MCGIAGYIGKKRIDKSRIHKTLHLMKNRGPDYSDYKRFKKDKTEVLLLHSRLAIIDLDRRANQPFTIGDYSLIFNGEIYNYKELRQNLEKQGVKFSTESDTEVLLRSFMEYGESCVQKFEGMWSFAIYSEKKGELFFSRDRFGEKPLYFLEINDGLFFGSEVKYIKSLSGISLSVNECQILRYLVYGYKSLYKNDETFFERLKELPSATNMTVVGNTRPQINRYWKPTVKIRKMTLHEAIEGFRHHLMESVRIRLRADVPLAFCLSGGVDSSAIVSIAAKKFNYKVATFSLIDPDERYNEYDNIKATIDDLGCEHTIIEIPKGHPFVRLENLIRYHDSPIATISYFIHSLLSKAMAQKGYKVACSGTAADELVTGYYDHFNLYLCEMKNNPSYPKYLREWKKHISRFVRNPHLKNPELYFENPHFRNHIYLNNDIFESYLKKDFKESFEEENYCHSLLRNRMLNEMFHEVIPVILQEDDLNSMFYSVENRSPYLDSRLFAFSYSIPVEYLIQEGYGKYILREAMKGILNDKVRLDRQKKGFNASINSLIDFNDKKNRDYILEDGRIFDYVKRNRIEELLQKKEPLTNSYSKFLFNVINAKIFLEMHG